MQWSLEELGMTMHGNSGDMDAGGWHAIGRFRVRTCQRKGAYR